MRGGGSPCFFLIGGNIWPLAMAMAMELPLSIVSPPIPTTTTTLQPESDNPQPSASTYPSTPSAEQTAFSSARAFAKVHQKSIACAEATDDVAHDNTTPQFFSSGLLYRTIGA